MNKRSLKELIRKEVQNQIKEHLDEIRRPSISYLDISDRPADSDPVNEKISFIAKLISEAMQATDRLGEDVVGADEEEHPYAKGGLEKNLGDLWFTLQKAGMLTKNLYKFPEDGNGSKKQQ